MYTAIALALAAVGSALPAPQLGSASGVTPPKDQEFALAMKVDGSLVSLNAVNNGTANEFVLEAERLSVYPGTPGVWIRILSAAKAMLTVKQLISTALALSKP